VLEVVEPPVVLSRFRLVIGAPALRGSAAAFVSGARAFACRARAFVSGARVLACGARSLACDARSLACGARVFVSGARVLACGARALACDARSLACGARALACGARALACDARALACGARALACGARAFVSEARVLACRAVGLASSVAGFPCGVTAFKSGHLSQRHCLMKHVSAQKWIQTSSWGQQNYSRCRHQRIGRVAGALALSVGRSCEGRGAKCGCCPDARARFARNARLVLEMHNKRCYCCFRRSLCHASQVVGLPNWRRILPADHPIDGKGDLNGEDSPVPIPTLSWRHTDRSSIR